MSSRRSNPITAEQGDQLIAETQATDLQAARSAVAEGVASAQNQWIEAPLIAQALAEELICLAQTNHTSSQVATYLRQLAHQLDVTPDYH